VPLVVSQQIFSVPGGSVEERAVCMQGCRRVQGGVGCM